MLKIPLYQIDAFTHRIFGGNPAAVCPMEKELPDNILQRIAAENNLAETAFVWKVGDHFKIRWFTPTTEVDLCGHATLASALVYFTKLNYPSATICFDSRSGPLFVSRKKDDQLVLDFPRDEFQTCLIPSHLEQALGTEIIDCIRGKSDFMVSVKDEYTVRLLKPDFASIKNLPSRGLIVTAPGNNCDFVSRCFFPQSGIDEDPVTGSAHTTLVPYWSPLLHKNSFVARQVSAREGILYCELKNDRVLIGGYAQLYLEGHIYVPVYDE